MALKTKSLLARVHMVEAVEYQAGERVRCAKCDKPVSTTLNSKVIAYVLCPDCTEETSTE